MTNILDLSRPRSYYAWHDDLRRLGFHPVRIEAAHSVWHMAGHPDATCETWIKTGYGYPETFAKFHTPWGKEAIRNVDVLHDVTAVLVDGARDELADLQPPDVIDLRPIADNPVCTRLRALGFHTRTADHTIWLLTDIHGAITIALNTHEGIATITDRETKAEAELTFTQLEQLDHIKHGWN